LHNIEHEHIFTNHDGYVFHDSRGIESGSEIELEIVRDFVKRKSWEKRLEDRLHVIWYCIPMDNDRPSLETKYFKDICQNKDVPVIAVFTKFDQFKIDTEMKLEDEDRSPHEMDIKAEVECKFRKHYLAPLTEGKEPPPYIRLEKIHKPGQGRGCTELIERTADALGDGVLSLVLMAVQRDNLELNINRAVKWIHDQFNQVLRTETVIKLCVAAFPSIWFKFSFDFFPDLRNSPDDDLLFKFNGLNALISKLTSEIINLLSTLSGDNTHHTVQIMIATILILEHACVLSASLSPPPLEYALGQAISAYRNSENHDLVMKQFPRPLNEYSIPEYTKFILQHHLR